MNIKNINSRIDPHCTCGSWMQHWQKYSGQHAVYCPVVDCYNKDLVGTHVQKASGRLDGVFYVYPLCKVHKHSEGVLTVSDSYVLVPADKLSTCERR